MSAVLPSASSATAPWVGNRCRAVMTNRFRAEALAGCVITLFRTPLEAPASWRATNQTSGGSELF